MSKMLNHEGRIPTEKGSALALAINGLTLGETRIALHDACKSRGREERTGNE